MKKYAAFILALMLFTSLLPVTVLADQYVTVSGSGSLLPSNGKTTPVIFRPLFWIRRWPIVAR